MSVVRFAVLCAVGWTLSGVVGAQAPLQAAEGVDATQNFQKTPNFPVSDDLPTEPNPVLPDGLALLPGAVSKAAMDFRPGGSTGTRAKLDAQVYYNAIFGDQNMVTGPSGVEGDSASNFTRPRHYDQRSPYNLLNFVPGGLNLGTTCSDNNTSAGCTPGRVYGAFIRLPTNIVPGDIVSVTMQTGNSQFFWAGPALYTGVQTTPGPGGNPYKGAGSLHFATCFGEIDINDNYYVYPVPLGHQLKMGALANATYAENPKGACFRRAPYQLYDADGPNFKYHPNRGHAYSEVVSTDTFGAQHTYTLWITNDGSNLLHFFFDGRLVSTQYYEPSLAKFTAKNGTEQPVGYHLVIACQTIPVFLNPSHNTSIGVYAHILPNDGGPIVGSPWSATVAAIKIVHGGITPAALSVATVDRNGTDGQTYDGLRDYSPR